MRVNEAYEEDILILLYWFHSKNITLLERNEGNYVEGLNLDIRYKKHQIFEANCRTLDVFINHQGLISHLSTRDTLIIEKNHAYCSNLMKITLGW